MVPVHQRDNATRYMIDASTILRIKAVRSLIYRASRWCAGAIMLDILVKYCHLYPLHRLRELLSQFYLSTLFNGNKTILLNCRVLSLMI